MGAPHTISGVLEDAIIMAEEILDREDMDYDQCAAMEGFDLCGSSWCESCGCVVDKLSRARRALEKATILVKAEVASALARDKVAAIRGERQ